MEEADPRHLLIKVAEILEALGIPYAVTGGMAVFVWARPRFTADIDIVILLQPERVARLTEALRGISEAGYIEPEAIEWALARRGEFNFLDGATGVKVDFFVLGSKPFDESQLNRRIPKTVLGRDVYFISPEDLILAKLLWYKESESSRQLEDIQSIIALQENLDWDYLKRWSKLHGTDTILKDLKRKV